MQSKCRSSTTSVARSVRAPPRATYTIRVRVTAPLTLVLAYPLDTAHWDGFPASVLRTMPTGQRLVTALGYLTSVTDGGETRLASGMVVPAVQGRLLIFHNTAHGTTSLDLASRHAGQLVRSGEKWAFNLWFKEYLRENTFKYAVLSHSIGALVCLLDRRVFWP